ncbi:MAG: NUDIX domain-containing protein [Pseudomonadales bacterium]|jgi:ADP-ribose pyrophosphatase YjhB (NUDIX family)|nr:NUDIX domain-containing protein [Pseudomonadales bacterium]MDP6472745.1 NUDIX domain-containing protein [Pseudomonadales bacterium]MDP6827958.1 NUDIX domain-containing protein [Pseudomonadales bacterium]MDP6973121.1 NUDIX domain-containing protein [Pseudomonadales bacterium]|tara:strand:+ start:2204 stop:2677 length:474 start_codon:yes stop_codon:yes gene_type:complete
MIKRIRHAARAIILTRQAEILLMRMAFPWREDEVWILPGGGIEAGETAEQAVRREVFEETGATDIRIVGEAWRREFLVEATGVYMKQRYFLVNAERFVPAAGSLLGPEGDWLKEYRWWSCETLLNQPLNAEPQNLGKAVNDLRRNGCPSRWIDLDGL